MPQDADFPNSCGSPGAADCHLRHATTPLYLLPAEPIPTQFGGWMNDETFAFAGEYFFRIPPGYADDIRNICTSRDKPKGQAVCPQNFMFP